MSNVPTFSRLRTQNSQFTAHNSFPEAIFLGKISYLLNKDKALTGEVNALIRLTQCIAFFSPHKMYGALPYIKVVRHTCLVMLSLLLHASLITDEQGRVGACLSYGVEEGTVQNHLHNFRFLFFAVVG